MSLAGGVLGALSTTSDSMYVAVMVVAVVVVAVVPVVAVALVAVDVVVGHVPQLTGQLAVVYVENKTQ